LLYRRASILVRHFSEFGRQVGKAGPTSYSQSFRPLLSFDLTYDQSEVTVFRKLVEGTTKDHRGQALTLRWPFINQHRPR
jgi:hypothetical protein